MSVPLAHPRVLWLPICASMSFKHDMTCLDIVGDGGTGKTTFVKVCHCTIRVMYAFDRVLIDSAFVAPLDR